MNRRTFISRSLSAAAGLSLAGWPRPAAASGETVVFFALNTQDFAYPEYTAVLLDRALTLHESLGVPLDIYLTTWMVDLLQGAGDLARRLVTSPVVSLAYHTRAPLPYRVNYDWYGLSGMTTAEQYAVVMAYETHGLDMVTGMPLERPGGYQHYANLIGRPPRAVGIASEASIQGAVDTVFRDLGARITVANDRLANLGSMRNGLYERPEHVDLKLFERVGESPAAILDQALAEAPATAGAVAPYFVGVKMHDNDFFASQSAWTAVYLAPGARRGPPWDTSLRATLLTEAEMAARWSLWEGMVREVAARGIPVVNSEGLLQQLADPLRSLRTR
ncbi:MAG: hypothetical protein AB7H88_04770 [Vicinamibacterales bacterium]